jgi:hypothetical protein
MTSWKAPFRVLIAVGSLAGFFGSWALLAHAPKPVPPVVSAPQVDIGLPAPDLPRLSLLPALPSLPGFSLPRLHTHAS